jgi:hypothetical protein
MLNNTAAASPSPSSSTRSVGERFASALKRAKAVVVDPVGMWPVVKAEAGDERALYRDFLFLLMAISPVCQVVGQVIFGKAGFLGSLGLGFILYVFGLGLVYLMGLVVHKLVGLFGGTGTRLDCLRLVAYSYSAAFFLGFLGLFPFLLVSIIGGILSLYSLYILYTGIPVMAGVAQERVVGFFAATLAAWVAVFLVAGMVTAPFVSLFAPPAL